MHPFVAGCFPSTPVHAVELHLAAADSPPVWFTFRLLKQLLKLRVNIQRAAVTKLAQAHQEYLEEELYSNFLDHIKSDRFRKAMATALDGFAQLHLKMKQNQVLGLPREGLADVCTCCHKGVSNYLLQEGVDCSWLKQGSSESSRLDGSNVAGQPTGQPVDVDSVDAAEQQEQPPVIFGSDPATAASRHVYAAMGISLVLHSVMIDGLQKMRHFKNAGG